MNVRQRRWCEVDRHRISDGKKTCATDIVGKHGLCWISTHMDNPVRAICSHAGWSPPFRFLEACLVHRHFVLRQPHSTRLGHLTCKRAGWRNALGRLRKRGHCCGWGTRPRVSTKRGQVLWSAAAGRVLIPRTEWSALPPIRELRALYRRERRVAARASGRMPEPQAPSESLIVLTCNQP